MNYTYQLPWEYLDNIYNPKKKSTRIRNHMPRQKMEEIFRLLDCHLSGAEIARRTGASQSHISKIKRKGREKAMAIYHHQNQTT